MKSPSPRPAPCSRAAPDNVITAKIKAKLIAEQDLSSLHVKVVTENGVSYLMGLVSEEEGDIATDGRKAHRRGAESGKAIRIPRVSQEAERGGSTRSPGGRVKSNIRHL